MGFPGGKGRPEESLGPPILVLPQRYYSDGRFRYIRCSLRDEKSREMIATITAYDQHGVVSHSDTRYYADSSLLWQHVGCQQNNRRTRWDEASETRSWPTVEQAYFEISDRNPSTMQSVPVRPDELPWLAVMRMHAMANYTDQEMTWLTPFDAAKVRALLAWAKFLPVVAPAEAVGDRPVDEEGFTDNISGGKITPGSGVEAVHGIVAHDDVMVGADGE